MKNGDSEERRGLSYIADIAYGRDGYFGLILT